MDAVFVDSNILIYSQDTSEPLKQRQAHSWLEHLWRTRTGRVSFQVLREVYINLTRHLPNPLPVASARSLVRLFLEWNPRPESPEYFETAWKIERRRMYTSLRNDASNGTEVFRVPRDYALTTLGETFDQNICDGALAPTARPLF